MAILTEKINAPVPSGTTTVQGLGTAGTPIGGVVSVQGLNKFDGTPSGVVPVVTVSAGAVPDAFGFAALFASSNGYAAAAAVANGAWDGNTTIALRTPNVFKNLLAVLITGETTIWTPAAGKKFRIMGFVITQGVLTGNITLRDNTAGTTILVIPATPIGQSLYVPLGNGIRSAAANNVLTAQGAATETISGFVFGTEE